MRLLMTIALATLFGATHLTAQDVSSQKPSQEEIKEAHAQLDALLGDWSLALDITNDNGNTWSTLESQPSKVRSILAGKMVHEKTAIHFGGNYKMEGEVTYSFDVYRNVYRVTWNDNINGLLDVYEGQVIDGKLVVDNLKSGTSWIPEQGSPMNFRLSWGFESNQKRSYIIESTDDGGLTWNPYLKGMYTRSH